LTSDTRRCYSININAPSLEAYVWSQCLEMLQHPEMITQLSIDEYERLVGLDANRAGEVQRLRQALAEQEAAKQRVINLVRRDLIREEDTVAELAPVNAEIGRIHAEFSALDTTRSLASAFLKRIKSAEATVKDPVHAGDFVRAMRAVRPERLRDGALRWELFHDPADPHRHVETFLVESWGEHLRQHERATLADREAEARPGTASRPHAGGRVSLGRGAWDSKGNGATRGQKACMKMLCRTSLAVR
jgi:Transmembrane secretion effector